MLADQGHNLAGNNLIKHNQVVFSMGEGALQVLPPLVDVIPEARLNLVIYYLRHGGIQEAYELIKDLEPSTPSEYILKAVVNASVGQEMGSREHIKMAQQFFQLVGSSASECDTIPGRQVPVARGPVLVFGRRGGRGEGEGGEPLSLPPPAAMAISSRHASQPRHQRASKQAGSQQPQAAHC